MVECFVFLRPLGLRLELTNYANVTLQAEPGFNIPVINAMMHVILKEGLHDADYIAERCEGFEEFAASVEEFTPEHVEGLTGLPAESIREAARLYATSKPASRIVAMSFCEPRSW